MWSARRGRISLMKQQEDDEHIIADHMTYASHHTNLPGTVRTSLTTSVCSGSWMLIGDWLPVLLAQVAPQDRWFSYVNPPSLPEPGEQPTS